LVTSRWTSARHTQHQNSGYGLDLAYTPTKGRWEAYVRYWNIRDADYVVAHTFSSSGYGYEPENSTIEIGARFAF